MSALTRTVRKLRWSLIHRGTRQTLQLPLQRLRESPGPRIAQLRHPFDDRYGTETSGVIGGVTLASAHPNSLHATAYHGVPPSRLHVILESWRATPPALPLTQYTFLDLGCGKGRAIMLASQLPFRECIGVELNADLAAVAAANLKTFQRTGAPLSPSRIVHGDAATFALPMGPCLLFLYNPFSTRVAAQLLGHLQRSLAAAPRPLDVLYFTPHAHALFCSHPQVELLWQRPVAISPEEAAAEPVRDVEDLCAAYRFRS
ncbi:MAG: hypothetical protein KGK08_00675 [Acidobacteriota bacterium]|nr:hypothetical protein [Acidobacteriota bacterium]